MSAHTSGPWFVNGKQSIRGAAGEYVAKTNWLNGEANARLIAAAPDLLQALLNLIGTMCAADGSDMEADLDAIDARVGEAKAAIAKATGGQQ